MKSLVLAAVLAFTTSAFAAKVSQDEADTAGNNNVSVTLGSAAGGFVIGAEYERMMTKDYGLGGVIKNYSLNHQATLGGVDIPGGGHDGVFVLGAQASMHIVRSNWGDIALTPGFALYNISRVASSGSEITAGPSLAISATHQFTSMFSGGLEWVQYYSWFDSAYNGLLREDISAKVRMTF